MDIIASIKNNFAASVALAVSLISVFVTISLGRREKQNIMPYGCNIDPLTRTDLILTFLNTSHFNIQDLTINIIGFNDQFNVIPDLTTKNKYLFTIGEKTEFFYSINIGTYAERTFYLRVHFKGKYKIRFPFWSRLYEQPIWFSATPKLKNSAGTGVMIVTTHRDEINSLETRHQQLLRTLDRETDIKFSK